MFQPLVRIALVLALAAGMLVPELMTPVRAITRPETLAERHTFRPGLRAAKLDLEIAATHAMFSWSGAEGSGIKYRYVKDGELTPWRRAPESHDMEHGRRHYSAPLLLDRSRHLEWRAYGEARGVTLDYVNTLDGPRRRIVLPAVARAGARQPNVVTRAEWGADESIARRTGSCQRSFHPVSQLFIHHTVTSNYDPDPSSTVRAIYHFHTESRGWCDIGYNFLVGQNGQVFEGRWARSYKPWEVHDGEDRSGRITTGAHVSDFNSGTIGISVLGNYQSTPIKAATRRSLVGLLAWEADRHDLKPRGWHTYRNPYDGTTKRLPYIAGHRDAGQTSCPGARLYRALPSIRKEVARTIGRGKLASHLVGQVKDPVTYGQPFRSRFRLTKPNGDPLANRPITFYRRASGRPWVTLGTAPTNERGWAAMWLRPQRNLKVVASWPGDSYRWGSDALIHQKVRPLITIAAEGSSDAVSPGVYEFPEGTSEVYIGGEVLPQHRDAAITIRTWQIPPEGPAVRMPDRTKKLVDGGTYRAKLTIPPEGGTFRVKTILPSHKDHATGRSRAIRIVVPPPFEVPIP